MLLTQIITYIVAYSGQKIKLIMEGLHMEFSEHLLPCPFCGGQAEIKESAETAKRDETIDMINRLLAGLDDEELLRVYAQVHRRFINQ